MTPDAVKRNVRDQDTRSQDIWDGGTADADRCLLIG